ncbi:MAG: hypothetical protein P8X57_16150 [Cyclobacteriaceae bacterium]
MFKLFMVLVFCSLLVSCNSTSEESEPVEDHINFNAKKWKTKNESGSPFREQMVNSVLYSDSIRALSKPEVLDLLGKPDRTNENHLYYLIDESNLGMWTLHATSLVIKFNVKDSVEWIKLHE